jgi:tRNA pseudouridine13 synthase
MKLKQHPEDFRVEEISTVQITKEPAEYKIYLLEKKNAETFALISYLSAKNRIPAHEFGIAGLKDKHALTRQYFSIPSKYRLNTSEEKNFRISFAGYSKNRIKLGDLKGNRFEITARGIKKGEIDGIKQKAESLPKIGAPNYYDSQRFGSASNGEFIIKHAMKKNYERAVKIYLTDGTKSEGRAAKQDKKNILENWGAIEKVQAKTKRLARVIEEYKKTRSWQSAYRRIPSRMRELYVSAYQSYLWNECLKEILRKNAPAKTTYSIEYKMGALIFYKKQCMLPEILNTISDEINSPPEEKIIVERILAREGITLDDFRIKNATGNFFKTHERKTKLVPEDFKITIEDEKNSYKARISFSLPKGSYATIITKRLFNK